MLYVHLYIELTHWYSRFTKFIGFKINFKIQCNVIDHMNSELQHLRWHSFPFTVITGRLPPFSASATLIIQCPRDFPQTPIQKLLPGKSNCIQRRTMCTGILYIRYNWCQYNLQYFYCYSSSFISLGQSFIRRHHFPSQDICIFIKTLWHLSSYIPNLL